MGGGIRTPKFQEVLQEYLGVDLGKSLNMDEAHAMGAVYKAADLGTGFKVKKFLTKDAVLYPIQVSVGFINENYWRSLVKVFFSDPCRFISCPKPNKES